MTSKSSGARFRPRTRRRLVLAAVVALVAHRGGLRAGAARLVTWPTPAQEIATSGIFTTCRSAARSRSHSRVHDGFGINAWSQESYAAVRSEAAKCTNVKEIVAAGGGDLQKSISDINSMVAQGANAIVIIPDFGQAQLAVAPGTRRRPASRSSRGAPIRAAPGTDYVALRRLERRLRRHDVGQVDGQGARTARATSSSSAARPATRSAPAQLEVDRQGLRQAPGHEAADRHEDWPVTNWDPATAQKQMTAALLAKYPKIDGIISNYGTDALASDARVPGRRPQARADRDARRQRALLPVQEGAQEQPAFQLATISSRNWLGRIAARKAIAAAEGLPNKEPSIYQLPFFEDTVSGQEPRRAYPSAAPDFYPSNKLTQSHQISKYGKPS